MATQKSKLRKWIIPSCNIHTIEEKTLGRGLKGGEKEELGEEEWVSLNTLSQRGVFVCVRMNERGIYNSGRGNINERPFNESWKRIINLDLILAFGEV